MLKINSATFLPNIIDTHLNLRKLWQNIQECHFLQTQWTDKHSNFEDCFRVSFPGLCANMTCANIHKTGKYITYCNAKRTELRPQQIWKSSHQWTQRYALGWTYMLMAWLSVWSEVQTCIWPSWCHCQSLSLAPVKSRLVLPFWYRLTQVVLEKRPLNGCSVVEGDREWNEMFVTAHSVHVHSLWKAQTSSILTVLWNQTASEYYKG